MAVKMHGQVHIEVSRAYFTTHVPTGPLLSRFLVLLLEPGNNRRRRTIEDTDKIPALCIWRHIPIPTSY